MAFSRLRDSPLVPRDESRNREEPSLLGSVQTIPYAFKNCKYIKHAKPQNKWIALASMAIPPDNCILALGVCRIYQRALGSRGIEFTVKLQNAIYYQLFGK